MKRQRRKCAQGRRWQERSTIPSRSGELSSLVNATALHPQTKTALALLYDEGLENAYDVRLKLTKEVLTIQKQDVVCIGGAPPGANVSAPASRAWLKPSQVQELLKRPAKSTVQEGPMRSWYAARHLSPSPG